MHTNKNLLIHEIRLLFDAMMAHKFIVGVIILISAVIGQIIIHSLKPQLVTTLEISPLQNIELSKTVPEVAIFTKEIQALGRSNSGIWEMIEFLNPKKEAIKLYPDPITARLNTKLRSETAQLIRNQRNSKPIKDSPDRCSMIESASSMWHVDRWVANDSTRSVRIYVRHSADFDLENLERKFLCTLNESISSSLKNSLDVFLSSLDVAVDLMTQNSETDGESIERVKAATRQVQEVLESSSFSAYRAQVSETRETTQFNDQLIFIACLGIGFLCAALMSLLISKYSKMPR